RRSLLFTRSLNSAFHDRSFVTERSQSLSRPLHQLFIAPPRNARLIGKPARGGVMRQLRWSVMMAMTMTLAATAAAPAYAQEPRGYVTGLGGFASSTDGTSGDMLGEAGVRVAPHLSVFASLGRFQNLQPSDVQPAVDLTVAAMSAGTGLNLSGTAATPPWDPNGGVRYGAAARGPLTPLAAG